MKWIDKCLGALRQSSIPVSTILIDNGSSDGTLGYVRKEFPEIEIYRMEKNLGFGQANNYGINKALEKGCDFVYLLNQDAYIAPDMFEKLIEAYRIADKELIGVISPLHLYRDNIHLDAQFKSYLCRTAADIAEDVLLDECKPFYPVDIVPAAGWLLPRKTFEIVGGFDPIYFHYGEDEHYAQRLKFHKLKMLVAPKAKMIHDRDGFGNEKMARRDDLFSGLKVYYFLNINYTKDKLLFKLVRIGFSYIFESFRCMLDGKFNRSMQYYSGYFRNIFNIPKYRKNRRINRQTGPNWL